MYARICIKSVPLYVRKIKFSEMTGMFRILFLSLRQATQNFSLVTKAMQIPLIPQHLYHAGNKELGIL